MSDNFDEYMEKFEQRREEKRKREEEKRQIFFKKCADKITDGEFIYNLLAQYIAKRFKIDIEYCNESPVYALLNHYVEEVEEDFLKWIHKNNAPIIWKASEMSTIFHEFKQLENSKTIMEMANKVYGLNLEYCHNCLDFEEDYVFAYEFDFNSFTPIDIDEVIELKKEIDVLKKYNHDTSELESRLKNFNLPKKILEMI